MSQPVYPSPYRFATPKATQRQLLRRSVWDTCQNLYLLLHQYVPREAIEGRPEGKPEGRPEGKPEGKPEPKPDKNTAERQRAKEQQKAKEKEPPGKAEWLIRIAQREPSDLFDGELHAAWLRRWLALATAYHASQFRAQTVSRLVVGLGGQSALETDLLVHPLYGVPYVPGSALKGLTRAYAEVEVLPDAQDKTLRAAYERIFGAQKQSGSVIFFDAIPASMSENTPAPDVRLDVDIMNPHYPEYYRDTTNEKPPSDDQDPLPVPFLAVAPFCVFHFAVAPRPDGSAGSADAETAARWLQKALSEYGVGAKTNAGYGRFEVITETPGATNGQR